MFQHHTKIRVRYADTDQMGYLYYGNYATYYEVGRAEAMRAIGLTYRRMEEEHKVMMPVVAMDMRFVRPAYYDDLLTVHSMVKKLPDKFITFHMEIRNEKAELINGGSVKLCFVDAVSKKSIRVPDFLHEALTTQFLNENP